MEMVKLLLLFVITPILLIGCSTTSPYCPSDLEEAAINGKWEEVDSLLDEGADINGTVGAGLGPLSCSIRYYQPEISKFLVRKGADVNLKGFEGTTPLHWAAYSNRMEIASLLLKHGADADTCCSTKRWGKTPLDWAERWKYYDFSNFLQAHKNDYGQWKNYLEKNTLSGFQLFLKKYPKNILTSEAKSKLEMLEVDYKNKIPQIETEEGKGNKAQKAGRHKEALDHYIAALRMTPLGTPIDERLRKKTISLVFDMDSKLVLPQEAKRLAIRGQSFLKRAKDKEGYELALDEFQKSVQVAPWWASGYFNLGIIQEKIEDYNGAISNLNFYLLASPNARDGANVRKKIIDLEVAMELYDKAHAAKKPSTSTMQPKKPEEEKGGRMGGVLNFLKKKKN